MSECAKVLLFAFALCVASAASADIIDKHGDDNKNVERSGRAARSDLDTSATSAKLFNLGSLFGQQPPYGNGYYPNTYRPNYYNTGYGGYNPTTTWTGSGYYPTTGGGYYPTTSSGYYPTNGYYPTGTNILGGNGGYGGYGGNGGLRQYSGYWNPDYNGYRNRGYGYYADTDRFGLPKRERDSYYDSYGYGGRERERTAGGYRGYD